MINLFLAVLWLLLALVAFLWPWLRPGAETPTIYQTGIPWFWAFLALTDYNLVRWGLVRAGQQRRRELQQEAERRWQQRERRRPEQAPDPTFDFSEGPPPRRPEPPPEGS